MVTALRPARQKISTTVSPATLACLEGLIQDGSARNLAEAMDLVVQKLLDYENRERLENDTRDYFERLSPEALDEESNLGAALANSARRIDFDHQP